MQPLFFAKQGNKLFFDFKGQIRLFEHLTNNMSSTARKYSKTDYTRVYPTIFDQDVDTYQLGNRTSDIIFPPKGDLTNSIKLATSNRKFTADGQEVKPTQELVEAETDYSKSEREGSVVGFWGQFYDKYTDQPLSRDVFPVFVLLQYLSSLKTLSMDPHGDLDYLYDGRYDLSDKRAQTYMFTDFRERYVDNADPVIQTRLLVFKDTIFPEMVTADTGYGQRFTSFETQDTTFSFTDKQGYGVVFDVVVRPGNDKVMFYLEIGQTNYSTEWRGFGVKSTVVVGDRVFSADETLEKSPVAELAEVTNAEMLMAGTEKQRGRDAYPILFTVEFSPPEEN